MFKIWDIADLRIVFNPNYELEAHDITNEEFEKQIIQLFEKRDFYHLYMLSHINYNTMHDYTFKNKRSEEILNLLNIRMIRENVLFLESDFNKIFDINISVYEDLGKIKIVDVSEMIVVKNYLRTVLFARNPHLLSPDYVKERNREDQKISLIMLKYLDLSALKAPDEDRAEWFCNLFTIDSITNGLSTYYDKKMVLTFFTEYFSFFTHNKFYNQYSINEILKDTLNNKDYEVFENIYSIFEDKVFDIAIYETALAHNFAIPFQNKLVKYYQLARFDYFKKLNEFNKEVGGLNEDLSTEQIFASIKEKVGKDKNKNLIYVALKNQYKMMKKIDKRYPNDL